MSSTVWAVPATRVRETYILRFLKDAKCSVRVVEVRLFKTGPANRSSAGRQATLGARRRSARDRQGDLEVHRRQWIGRCHDCSVRRNFIAWPISQSGDLDVDL